MKILFQGDSITDAGRTGLSYETLGCGYPLLVAGELSSRFPDRGFVFQNRGISGNRVVDLYQRWKVDALNLKPDVISILIGVNDTWHENFGNGVEVPRAKRVAHDLLSWTREVLPDVKFVICEPFVLTKSISGLPAEGAWSAEDRWEEEIRERSRFMKEFADEFGAAWVPCQKVLDDALKLAPAPHWTGDGVHPTVAGHALLAKAWIEAASPLLGL